MEIKLISAKIAYLASVVLFILAGIKSSTQIAIIGLALVTIAIGLGIWHYYYLFTNPRMLAEKILNSDNNEWK